MEADVWSAASTDPFTGRSESRRFARGTWLHTRGAGGRKPWRRGCFLFISQARSTNTHRIWVETFNNIIYTSKYQLHLPRLIDCGANGPKPKDFLTFGKLEPVKCFTFGLKKDLNEPVEIAWVFLLNSLRTLCGNRFRHVAQSIWMVNRKNPPGGVKFPKSFPVTFTQIVYFYLPPSVGGAVEMHRADGPKW